MTAPTAHNSRPRVSVVIPLYNHEKFVREAIESVLAQSFSDFELIVINDGSTDRSEGIVKEIRDDRIAYFAQANQGAANTINRGIGLAKGEYVSILNSDDVYHPNRLAEAVRLLEADRDVQAVFSYVEMIDEQGASLRIVRGAEENWSSHDPDTSFKGANDIVLDLLAGNFLMSTSNLFCRRSVFETIGLFSNLRFTHDYEFFLRLCHRCEVRVIENPLLRYRVHAANSLKASEAGVKFEIGVLLTEVLANGGMDRVYRHEPREEVALTKLFNSVATCDTEKMMMTLLLSAYRRGNDNQGLFKGTKVDSAFGKTCVQSFKKHIDEWHRSREAWKQMEEALFQLNERLSVVTARLDDYRKSYPYRLWRALTWLKRKLWGSVQGEQTR